MGTKYPTQSISGYNATPPADDGSEVDSNKVKWATHKDKLADPIKTLSEAIDAALVSYVDRQPLAKSTAYTTTTSDHLRMIEVSGTTTITLGAVASMGTGYTVNVKNAGSGVITLEGSGSETIDGDLNVTLNPKQSITCIVDSAAGAYLKEAETGYFDSGTLMLFQQTAAPTGWTKETTHDDKAFRVVTGTASSGGTSAFTTAFSSSRATDSHTLITTETPAHTHGASGSHTHVVPGVEDGGSSLSGYDWRTSASLTTSNHNTTGTGAHTHTSVGGNGGHTHDLSNFDVDYVDIIIAKKD